MSSISKLRLQKIRAMKPHVIGLCPDKLKAGSLGIMLIDVCIPNMVVDRGAKLVADVFESVF
jgi:hypothetical protein